MEVVETVVLKAAEVVPKVVRACAWRLWWRVMPKVVEVVPNALGGCAKGEGCGGVVEVVSKVLGGCAEGTWRLC